MSLGRLAVGLACALLAGGAVRAQTVVGHIARADVTEASAMAASRRQPGVFWTLNDSGGEPIVYAIDLNGRDLGAWRVTGATNEDWESLAVGPCKAGGAPTCLYIGETGDNDEKRPTRTLYRIAEPTVTVASPGALAATKPAERLTYAYDDGPHDVEALYIAGDASAWLVTKGRSKGVRAFRLGPEQWGSGQATARAILALPIPVDVPTRTLVTDAALSPDGAHVAIRTYGDVYVFAVDPMTGAPRLDPAPTVCDLRGLKEAQGEGVGWHASGKALLLSSEGIGGQLSLIACAPPKAAP